MKDKGGLNVILTNYTNNKVVIKDGDEKIILRNNGTVEIDGEYYKNVPNSLIDKINSKMSRIERQTIKWITKDERIEL